jgi:hypothetical protein
VLRRQDSSREESTLSVICADAPEAENAARRTAAADFAARDKKAAWGKGMGRTHSYW